MKTVILGDQGHRWEFPRISGNMAFVKFPREFPGFFSSLNLDYLRTNFMVKNFNYALNTKQRYFVTWFRQRIVLESR